MFDASGKHAFVGYYDSLRVYILDDVKPRVLDILPKGGYRDILDMKINNDSRYLFVCE